jgi:hypothetical protein
MAWAGQVSSKAVLLLTTILVRSSVLANLGAELPTGSAGEEGEISRFSTCHDKLLRMLTGVPLLNVVIQTGWGDMSTMDHFYNSALNGFKHK